MTEVDEIRAEILVDAVPGDVPNLGLEMYDPPTASQVRADDDTAVSDAITAVQPFPDGQARL
jgi:hypothetical protein